MHRMAMVGLLMSLATATEALADDEPVQQSEETAPEPEPDGATARGRKAFQRGLALAAEEQWGEALEAFLEAADARDSAVVQFNLAYCYRALGRYVAAQRAITRALATPELLTPPELEDARGYLAEFSELIGTLDITLTPKSAKLSVDGRRLTAVEGKNDVWAAGLGEPGEASVGHGRLKVLVDPGMHVFRAVRPGHADAVVRKSVRPGATVKLDLDLARLPATLRIQSQPRGAIVTVDGREVGLAPVEVERKAGKHVIEVIQDDYETYTATVDVEAGQRSELTAELEPYSPPLYERWWFWTAAAGVVAAGAVATWAATRTAPEPPPYNGGSTGWVVQSTTIRF